MGSVALFIYRPRMGAENIFSGRAVMAFMKKIKIARVLVFALAAASFWGCSSALESDPLPGEAAINGLSASVQGVTQPASLEKTDWFGPTDLGKEPYYVVLNFGENFNGNILGSDLTLTTFTYTYDSDDGTGTITTILGTEDFETDGTAMKATIPGGITVDASLIVPTLDKMTDTVWDTITPRNIYSSLDFEAATVQTTFGDGTFPLYGLLYYDGVSAGLIEDMGLFYLAYNEDDILTVVFPDFYRYHMGQDVVYTPSALYLASLNGTVWRATSGISEVLTFTTTGASFDGDDTFNATYVYNGKQAGGATNGAGSFLVIPGNPNTLRFYSFGTHGQIDFEQVQ
jgi:hypothetical protein